MKRLIITGSALLAVSFIFAQQKEGRVLYERTVQMQMRFPGMAGDEAEHMLPSSRKDKMEILFANNQSLRRTIADETPEEEPGGGGVQIRMSVAGADDISYCNFGSGLVTEQREFAAKKYIVADSIRKLNWKLTGASKTVLGYPCQQAVTQRIGQRTMMSMDNGQMKRQQIPDTSNIVVWFTSSIPVSAGPEYQGQLPGLILEIDINNGLTVYKALEVSTKVDATVIKEPKGGKKVSQEEFNKERDKIMEEMQKNSGGRGRVIRIGG